MKTLSRFLALCGFLLFSSASSQATPAYFELVNKLSLGMTEAQVIDILGKPNSRIKLGDPSSKNEAWYFRFSTLNGDSYDSLDSTKDVILTAIGRIRCHFREGVLTQLTGIWPAPKRPPSGVPKKKVMLVDVVKIYDELALTESTNTLLRKTEANLVKELEKKNTMVAQLDSESEKITSQLKHFNGSEKDRDALNLRSEELKKLVEAKKGEVQHFIAKNRALMKDSILLYQDVVLPALSDAIMLFKTEHGYDYVFETDQNVFSPGTKPIFVKGVDETVEILKWINSGGAKETGL